ncbi:MAG: hypothetical protein HYZ37_13700 [Candidatus Solibacter usitatus]|nr:hypothetical protein [Candidatus Solibacter usitatus]
MKLLLDECLPLDYPFSFPDHTVHTVEWAGLNGKKNGELLRMAESAGYEVLITVDQSISHQQNLSGHRISLLLLKARTNNIQDLQPLINQVLDALQSLRHGESRTIG